MIASVERDDGVWVRINPRHIVYVYPEDGRPDGPAVVVLSTGDKVRLKGTTAEFFERSEIRAVTGD